MFFLPIGEGQLAGKQIQGNFLTLKEFYEIVARFYNKLTFIQQDFIVYDLDLIF